MLNCEKGKCFNENSCNMKRPVGKSDGSFIEVLVGIIERVRDELGNCARYGKSKKLPE